MDLVYSVIGLAVLQFLGFGLLVGMQRVRRSVEAPAVTGDPVFERYHRVHYNTLEQLVVFVPAILMFAFYISANVAAGLGVLYLIGRLIYLKGYVADPRKRAVGFGVTWVANVILLLGGLGGAVRASIQSLGSV